MRSRACSLPRACCFSSASGAEWSAASRSSLQLGELLLVGLGRLLARPACGGRCARPRAARRRSVDRGGCWPSSADPSRCARSSSEPPTARPPRRAWLVGWRLPERGALWHRDRQACSAASSHRARGARSGARALARRGARHRRGAAAAPDGGERDDGRRASSRAALGDRAGRALPRPRRRPARARARRRPRVNGAWLVRVLIWGTTVLAVVAIFAVWANRQLLNPNNWANTSTQAAAERKGPRSDVQLPGRPALRQRQRRRRTQDAGCPTQLQPLAAPVAGALQNLAVTGGRARARQRRTSRKRGSTPTSAADANVHRRSSTARGPVCDQRRRR